MSNNNRSASEIEHEIEQRRAALTADLEILQGKFSLDGIIRQATTQISEHGGEIANSFSRSLRANPMAASMIAIGVGWMMFGGRRQEVYAAPSPAEEQFTDRPATTKNLTSRQMSTAESYHTPEWAKDDDWEARDDWRN